VIDLWANSNNWYQSEVEDLKQCLHREGEPTSASGQAIVARRSYRVEMASMPSSARQRAIVIRRSDVEGTTGSYRCEGGGLG
jgi:hypothetical protein